MKIMRLVLAVVLWIGLLAILPAAEWFVATNGTGGGTSWADATNSIQGAIDASFAGDTVWVSNGVYQTGGVTNFPTGTALTNRIAIYKAITVRSADNNPTNTIIKGAWASGGTTNGPDAIRCVYMANGSTLIGFTLTNGATLTAGALIDTYSGGVYCQSINTVISNCVIAGNSAGLHGGGAWYGTLFNCTLTGNSATPPGLGGGTVLSTLFNCTLTGNKAWANGGGGAYGGTLFNCTLTSNSVVGAGGGGGARDNILSNCTLTGNSSSSSGGGTRDCTLYNCTIVSNSAGGSSSGGGANGGTLFNCMLAGNSAGYGGGAYYSILYNCTLSGNSAGTSGGGASISTLYNCISWGNDKVDVIGTHNYSCGAGYTNGGSVSGNITNDPLFITNGTGYGTNHVAGNYRLRNVSPPLNAGTNFSWMTDPNDVRSRDLDGSRRIDGFSRQVDMGCYELMLRGTLFIFGQ